MKFISYLFFICLLLVGCGDPCDEIACANGATCTEGVCECAFGSGYEGTLCDIEMRSNLFGNWLGSEWCPIDSTFSEAAVIITPGAGILDLIVSDEDGEELFVGKLDPNVIGAYSFDYEGIYGIHEEINEEIRIYGNLENEILTIFYILKSDDSFICTNVLQKM